ncbi:hypothetical protein M0L20_28600 [Spirosoma sp. RP8]|uniref:Uncharacterized protein n=1 Tax=Spirosoma liriopis TaxID=2937440 RepID=A0ABT0HWG7_9BACT|nr:hypothetical protein [Spirosoma liriopis]MCK8495860.1 hypothetical protein [Spirosoma liriopis]
MPPASLSYVLLLVMLISSSFVPHPSDCRQIRITPYTTRKGEVDPFNLTQLVKKHFQQQGFRLSSEHQDSTDTNCTYYRCTLSHTENYWKFKRDTVCLTITDSEGKRVGYYCGVSGVTAMTFRSGYTTATREALASIKQTPFYR